MKYEKPIMELINFENVQDIICTSNPGGGGLNVGGGDGGFAS